jgi:outer membrane protein assembly factor BamA
MRKALPIALVCVSCIVLGQNQRSGWTDKNNRQMYAAYMLRTTYYERGYMSADVNVERSGGQDVFVVNPGPVFHFKDVKIVGLPENIAQQVMKDAPNTGEVYSAARITDWLEQEEKRLREESIVQRFAGEEARLDRANATATVTVLFK